MVATDRDTWPRPIPVGERLPKVGFQEEMVLAYLKFGFWEKGWFDDFGDGVQFVSVDDMISCRPGDATHWLALPPTPEDLKCEP